MKKTHSILKLAVLGYGLALMLVLGAWHPSLARAGRAVRVGAYDNPPKIFRATDGSMAGFWADLVDSLARRHGWDVTWVWGSWQEDLDNLESGRIDMMVDTGYSPARAQKFLFNDEPVLLSWSRIYVRRGDERIRAIPDLKGKRVGALEGSINLEGPGGLRELVKGFDLDCEVVTFPDYAAEFHALEQGELDAGVTNRDFGHLKGGDYDVQQTAIVFQPVRIQFAFSKASPLGPLLVFAVDRTMRAWKKDPGSLYYRLLARDFEAGVTERDVTPDWVAPILRLAAVAVLIMLAAFIVARLEIRRGRRKLEAARRELLKSEARYKEIFNSTGDAIFIHDIETGALVDVNQAMLDMYRCTRTEALEVPPERFSAGEPPFTMENAVARIRAAAAGRKQVFQWRARALDGRVFWVEVSLKDAEFGGSRWIIATVRDIDDRKRMESELLKADKLQSLGVLAGGIAHDFNNLLTAIMGNVSMAIDDLDPDHPARDLLRDTETASRRACDLTRQLLTFSRGGDPVRQATDLRAVIRDAADFVLRGSGMDITYDLDEDLWAADVDPGQIGQVIQNLVINARQAAGDTGHIRIACRNRGEPERPLIRLTVTDDGPGFTQEDQDHAFDPYYTTKADGSGLGLAICHSIVNRHGGSITLEPAPGGGARVVCDLPASPGGARERPQSEGGLQMIDRDILVMDDDTLVRDLAVRMLRHFHCRVTEAVDGAEAVAAYARALEAGRPFAAVIMDLTIPGGMGGKEAVRKILALDAGAKVIVSSGYSSDPVLANYRDYGFCAAVVKPYRMAELNAVLHSVLGS